jgi:ElaB/YqjD/DUF883 family membrane-anchored ribosome-binding protein
MVAPLKIKDEIHVLQKDISKVLHDITSISGHLASAGLGAAEAEGGKVVSAIEAELADLHKKISGLNGVLREYGNKADQSVRDHPYAYAAGALGFGYLLGKFLLGNSRGQK